MRTRTHLPWAHLRTMRRTLPVIRPSTRPSRFNIPSYGQSTAIRSGSPRTTRASEDRVRIRHGASGEESLCLAAVSRFHRVPGVEVVAGADFSHRLRGGAERRAGT